MTGIEVAVGLLITWLVRKAKRIGDRADTEINAALDAGMNRLHDLVVSRLGGDTAMAKLHDEAESGQVSDRTRDRVAAALEDTTQADPSFGQQLQALVEQIRAMASRAGGDVAVGGAAITGNVSNTGSGTAFGAVAKIDNFTVNSLPAPPPPGRVIDSVQRIGSPNIGDSSNPTKPDRA